MKICHKLVGLKKKYIHINDVRNQELNDNKPNITHIHISQDTQAGSVCKITHIYACIMQACTHLFNFFTSPAQSQIFPLIKSSSLFILVRSILQQLIASWAKLHLEKTALVSVLCLAVCVFLLMSFKWNSRLYYSTL